MHSPRMMPHRPCRIDLLAQLLLSRWNGKAHDGRIPQHYMHVLFFLRSTQYISPSQVTVSYSHQSLFAKNVLLPVDQTNIEVHPTNNVTACNPDSHTIKTEKKKKMQIRRDPRLYTGDVHTSMHTILEEANLWCTAGAKKLGEIIVREQSPCRV